MSFEVLHADSHRNGVGGERFQVAIVNDDELGTMLVIDFSYPGSSTPSEHYVAVLNLDRVALGDIYMHPQVDETGAPIPDTGNNAWRGDELGQQYRQAITDRIEARRDAWDRRAAAARRDAEALTPALAWEDAGTDEPGDQNADSTMRVAPGATSAYYSLGPTATGRWGLELIQIAHGEEIAAANLGDFRSAIVAKDFATWWENNGHVILASDEKL